jgi:hypothetical protein
MYRSPLIHAAELVFEARETITEIERLGRSMTGPCAQIAEQHLEQAYRILVYAGQGPIHQGLVDTVGAQIVANRIALARFKRQQRERKHAETSAFNLPGESGGSW